MTPLALSLLLSCTLPVDAPSTDPSTPETSDPSGRDDTGHDTLEIVPGPEITGPCAAEVEGLDTSSGDGAFLYSSQGAPHILDVCLLLSEEAIAALEKAPEDDVIADFIFSGHQWRVGVHLKGSTSFRDLSEKAAFKIDFAEWSDGQTLHGVRRLTLNNMIQDPTMAAEHMAYRLYASAGLPAPRHGYARVWVNDEWFGLYGIVETLDEQFMSKRLGDDGQGTLYEGGYSADLFDWAADRFEVQEGDEADISDLEALIEAVEAGHPDGVLALLAAHFDAEALLDLWAIEILTSNDDAYATNGNNYLLANPSRAGQWSMLPWGVDQCFQEDEDGDIAVYTALAGRLAEACRDDVGCSAALDARIALMLQLWSDLDIPGQVAAVTEAIESDCRSDPRSEWGDYGCRDQQAAMRLWAAARAEEVSTQLSVGPPQPSP